jgi:hypothetical protein
MRDGQQSMDVVVRSEDGLSLLLGAAQISEDRLLLVGTLIDPESPPRADTTIQVAVAPELAAGAHVQRVSDLTVLIDEAESLLHWEVETRELADG